MDDQETPDPPHDTPPWAEALRAAVAAAYRTSTLEAEEIERTFRAAQRISDARIEAGRAVGRARRAGWKGNHTDLWKAAQAMASLSGSLKQYPHRNFLQAEFDRWRNAEGGAPG